jgi:MFS family permease
VVGGLLLAVALGLAVLGLYNPNPDGKQILPDWGVPMVIGAAVAAVLFLLWEWQAKTRLIDPRNMRVLPFLAAMAASACTGAALMVTLVNVELFGRGVAGLSQSDAALALMWFLVALPIGAVVGGFLAERFGDRMVVIPGMLIASFGYLLISHWDVDVMTEHHQLGPIALPKFDTDLIIAGVGLGLVIAPLTSAALRVVPKAQHGIASSLVVVARMVGMLVGVAALSAWGLYRFHQIMSAANPSLAEIGAVSRRAFAQQYGEIFGATAVICLMGAALGALIAGRNVNVDGDEDDDAPENGDAAVEVSATPESN